MSIGCTIDHIEACEHNAVATVTAFLRDQSLHAKNRPLQAVITRSTFTNMQSAILEACSGLIADYRGQIVNDQSLWCIGNVVHLIPEDTQHRYKTLEITLKVRNWTSAASHNQPLSRMLGALTVLRYVYASSYSIDMATREDRLLVE